VHSTDLSPCVTAARLRRVTTPKQIARHGEMVRSIGWRGYGTHRYAGGQGNMSRRAVHPPRDIELHEAVVATTAEMQRVLRLVEKVARTESTVLITGESGTGKELIARWIHYASPRWQGPFVAVNCGAIPDTLMESELFGHVRGAFTGAVSDKRGLFQQAEDGTLFLDEVAEITPLAQVKLLRALQFREIRPVGSEHDLRVNVRVIAATNRDLQEAVGTGRLREDLYYRLNVVQIEIPPLREHRGDILPLAEYFVARFAEEAGRDHMALTEDTRRYLLGYDFPGNVRELENAMRRAVALADGPEITPLDLPPAIFRPRMLPADTRDDARDQMTLAEVEREHILRVLRYHHGNASKAAKTLGISRTTLWRKLNQYGRGPVKAESTRI
jgi:transcriptional regulator with PAS, ATPase and Fis domain